MMEIPFLCKDCAASIQFAPGISWLLRFCLAFVAAVCLAPHIASAAASPVVSLPRPNVLLLMGDDHAAYAVGCYGSAQVRTPNLDRLAAQGMRFDRAFCNSPVCTPSRQSLLTGRLPHAVGVTLLTSALPARELTLAEHLKAGGYETVSIGKMHFNSGLKHGFDLRVDQPAHRAWQRTNPPGSLPEGVSIQPAWRPFRDPARTWLNSEARPVGAREHDIDATFFAHEAGQILREARTRPLFLMVSFYQPHSPFSFPTEYAGKIDPERMPVAQVGAEDLPHVPLIFRDLTDAEKRGINAAYFTSVAFLDSRVGLVLEALRASGQETNTLVIYCSDHGYMLGQHGRFEKHASYDEAVRAPLIVRWPGRIKPGTSTDALVELVDLFPTIVEACGLEMPIQRHGRSLMPLLGQQTPTMPEFVMSQYHENEEAMIRTDRWKLVYCTGKRARLDGYETDHPTPGRYVRLFDLRNDPGEFADKSRDAKYQTLIRELKAKMAGRFESTANPDSRAPAGFELDETLDWYLVPPEARRARRAQSDE
jgi:arylsulfatase A-like enzyme